MVVKVWIVLWGQYGKGSQGLTQDAALWLDPVHQAK
jgi:hypothetical protein